MKVATYRPQGHAAPVEVVIPTKRERSVLRLIWSGRSVKAMADELDVSVNTLNQYVLHIRRALGLGSRAELQAWIAQHPNCMIPGQPVERRFHSSLPESPDATCPCLWCASLRLGTES